jgi:signal peptidase I
MKTSNTKLTAILIATVILFVILVKFILPSYTIPTPSMEKSFLVGDVLYSSKLNYGVRLPFSTLRLPGTQKVERGDIVIFNSPACDTIIAEKPERSYYDLCREMAYQLKMSGRSTSDIRQEMKESGYHIKTNSVPNREPYLKRCVALPGDKLEIRNGVMYINDRIYPRPENAYLPYQLDLGDSAVITEEYANKIMKEYGAELLGQQSHNSLVFRMTKANADKLKSAEKTKSVQPFYYPTDTRMFPVANVFPNDFQYYNWNVDNFGPITIPKKGMTLQLNDSSLCQYRRLIGVYEGNKLEQKGDKIYINSVPATTYTCQMDYYWMNGDNTHNSLDSRFFGFVPEDHILAKPLLILYSIDKNNGSIRSGRTLVPIAK